MSDTIDCPKCEHEHTPTGSYQDDVGERTCDKCGFKFRVEIDYDPTYTAECLVHEYGAFKTNPDWKATKVRFCGICGECDISITDCP